MYDRIFSTKSSACFRVLNHNNLDPRLPLGGIDSRNMTGTNDLHYRRFRNWPRLIKKLEITLDLSEKGGVYRNLACLHSFQIPSKSSTKGGEDSFDRVRRIGQK